MLGNAATNVAFLLTITCTSISLLCGIGGAANFNISLGSGNREDAEKFARNAIMMLVSLGVISCLVSRIFLKPMLLLFRATPDVFDYSLTYTGITSLGFPLLILATGGSNLVRATAVHVTLWRVPCQVQLLTPYWIHCLYPWPVPELLLRVYP